MNIQSKIPTPKTMFSASTIKFLTISLILLAHLISQQYGIKGAASAATHGEEDLLLAARVHPDYLKHRFESSHEEILASENFSIDREMSNNLVWDHFLRKYSSSQIYLKPNEVLNIVTKLRKCETESSAKTHENAGDDFTLVSRTRPTDKSCQDVNGTLMETISTLRNIHSLTELGTLANQLLYLIDNEDCCMVLAKTNSVPTPKHATSLENQSQMEKNDPSLESVAPMATNNEPKQKPTPGEVWGYGVLLVTIISLASVVGVSVMPVMHKAMYKYVLTTMIGLAVGSLIGSAVFHLMPRAFDLAANDPEHDYLFTALVVSGGIWMFFMVERFLKIIMDYKERKDKPSWERVKGTSTTPENSTISMNVDNNSHSHNNSHHNHNENHEENHNTTICTSRETELIYESQEQAIKASFGHQEKPKIKGHDHMLKFEQGKDSVIATVAWMIIFGDGLHNFIDGLSIGAAFNDSILTGVSISVAVFCEELPHELGDFAVLLNAGMSMKQAVTYNFLSACTCYLGMAVGIFLGDVEASSYIFGIATGMFLYISLVDMVPEMNEVAEQASKVSVKKGLFILLIQNIGIFMGIFTLFALAKYQDHIKF